MAVPYPQGECFFKKSALQSAVEGRFNAENPLHFYSNLMVEVIWNRESHHGPNEAKIPTGHPHRRSDYKIVYGDAGWQTEYGVWTHLPFSYGQYNHPTRRVQHELCTWGYRFKKREWGDAYESWFMFIPMPTRKEEWVFIDRLAYIRAIYIPVAHQASEKCPDLCTYVHVRFNSLNEVELEYHKDKTPNKMAFLYDFEEGEVSTAKLKFDTTLGLVPDKTKALGLNISKLVTTLLVPRGQRKHDAFGSGGIIQVDSSLIPLVRVQQNLTSGSMVDWKNVASKNQGLTIEWGKCNSKGPWFVTWFKDSMTFAIGWIPLIGPFLSIGWVVAFTAIQDPDGLMDQLRASIPSIQLTEGLLEEFKNLKIQTNAAVDDAVNIQNIKATESQKIVQEAPGPGSASQQPEKKGDIDHSEVEDIETDGLDADDSEAEDSKADDSKTDDLDRRRRRRPKRSSFKDVVAEISSCEAISEEEFKSLAAKVKGYRYFGAERTETRLKNLLAIQHRRGIKTLPNDKYGQVEKYNKEIEALYAQEK